jgi:hypothetical protein
VGGDEGEGELIDFVHPHPLNHVRFRALSCTLRGVGLTLPPAFAEAASRRQASKGEGIYRGNFKYLWLALNADEEAFAPPNEWERYRYGAFNP